MVIGKAFIYTALKMQSINTSTHTYAGLIPVSMVWGALVDPVQ